MPLPHHDIDEPGRRFDRHEAARAAIRASRGFASIGPASATCTMLGLGGVDSR